MVTHQLQVRCRPVKVRRSETDVLPLSHPTNYPCCKFGDCSFSRFWFSPADKQTQTDRQTDADERLTPATVIDVSKQKLLGLIGLLFGKLFCIGLIIIIATDFYSAK